MSPTICWKIEVTDIGKRHHLPWRWIALSNSTQKSLLSICFTDVTARYLQKISHQFIPIVMIQGLDWLMICSSGNPYGASFIPLHHSSKILLWNMLILWNYLVASCFILKKCSIRSERQIIVYLPRALNCGQLYGRPWDKTRNALINIPLEFTYPSNFTSLVICTPWAILVGKKEKPFEFRVNNICFIFQLN